MLSYRKRAFPIVFLLFFAPVGVAGDETSVEDDSGRIEEVVVTGTWILILRRGRARFPPLPTH